MGRFRSRRYDGLVVAIASLVTLLSPLGDSADAKARIIMAPRRFHFKIDPKTPVKDLMPPAPEMKEATPPWMVKSLAEVPEVLFAKQEAVRKPPVSESKSQTEREDEHDKAMAKT